METNVNYTLAGLFVIILGAFAVFSCIWLSSGLRSESYVYYVVYMKESVSGLNIDAPIEFNGVNVGTITEIKINHQNPRLVYLLLKVKDDTPITIATRAKLGMRSLTGIGYLLLEDQGTDKRPLVVLPGQQYPVIATIPSILVRLDTALTQLNNSFQQLSHSVRTLLSDTNLKAIQHILQSTRTSLHLIQTNTIPSTTQTVANFGNLADDLSSLSDEIKQNPAMLIRGKSKTNKLGPGE